ncbi:MAG: hypothetical protein WA956_03235 [Stenotrophomonas sp.]
MTLLVTGAAGFIGAAPCTIQGAMKIVASPRASKPAASQVGPLQ